MSNYDPSRIVELEESLAGEPDRGSSALARLEMLADLYQQADSYLPALETIERLLALPQAATLSASRRAALASRVVACRIAQGDCQAALAASRELLQNEASIESASVRALLHNQCAEALFRLGRMPECREHAERALAIADQAGDMPQAASALNTLGRNAYRAGELSRARDLYEQALALYRRLGDEASGASIRNNLGLLHKNLCEWDAAIAYFSAALEFYRTAGRFADTAPPLMNLGIVHQKSGDWTRAEQCYLEAARVMQQVNDQLHLTHTLIGRGNVARLERRFADAAELLGDALTRARHHGARREEVLALEFLGELEFDRGLPERALDRYQQAMPVAEGIAPEGDLVVELERRRAEALSAAGVLDEADRAVQRARRLARLTDDRLEFAVCHRVAGEIALARGDRAGAIEAWKLASALLADCRERLELGRVHLHLSAVVDDPRESRRQLYRAVALFSELSHPFWLERAETEIHARAAAPIESAPARPASLMGRRHRAPSLVAASNQMRTVESLAQRAASTELSVLVTGETGTGKELIARTIHGLSGRVERPFLAVNCGSLRVELALSQLFGHRKGAFTGAHAEGVGLVEAAHGGTLFLDEVGELPLDVQVTLLRFLETGEYLRLGETQVRRADVRVIAATNRELRGGEGERMFRRDLLFRLNEIEIRLPALHERLEDIVPLARHFLAFYGGIEGPHLSPEAEGMLRAYRWPGNVRELENVMKRVAALHAGDSVLDAAALLPFLASPEPRDPARANGAHDERESILSAYRQSAGNKSRLAELLGVSRKTLYARLKRLELTLP